MNLPFFTISIPAYKRLYLNEAIDSVMSQTYTNFELVIVDDASPEDLFSVVSQYDDDRIRYYKNDVNIGAVNVVDNWNRCLEYSKGDYIICMGDDDRLLPCCLEELVKLMDKYPGLGVYHAWTELIDENTRFKSLQEPRPEWESALSMVWNRWSWRFKQYIGDFCFDTSLLRKEGGFYKLPLAWGSDDITAVRAAMTKGIANTSRLCFQYRVNSQTITNTGSLSLKLQAGSMEKQWYEEFIAIMSEKKTLSYSDERYLSLISEGINRHFYEKDRSEIITEFTNHKSQLLKISAYGRSMGYSMVKLLYWWLVALKKRQS